eukprot:10411712-Ditylum_brightwellii.AAC.1
MDVTDVTATSSGGEEDEKTFHQCNAFLIQSYSHELRNLIASLLTSSLDHLHPLSIFNFGFVKKQPEFGVDGCWSGTGDCYVSKLFQDY